MTHRERLARFQAQAIDLRGRDEELRRLRDLVSRNGHFYIDEVMDTIEERIQELREERRRVRERARAAAGKEAE